MARKELLAKEKESTRRIHGRKQALRPKTASQAILVSTAVESSHATDEGEYPARWSCGTRIFTTAST
jgi:hypothetical protein